MPNTAAVDNNDYGRHELVIADSDGSHAVSFGRELRWASWGPDGKHVACIGDRTIQVIDLASRRVVREWPNTAGPQGRRCLLQQLIWSPDGKSFVATANELGPYWCIGCMDAETGAVHAISETDRYNCTPDWLPDSQGVVYARGIIPEEGGWAELWVGSRDGKQKRMLYAEDGRHIYGACVSPDGKYLIFTRSEKDLGGKDSTGTRMALMRWADAPMLGGKSQKLRERYPQARPGTVLDLSWGWEPHWTYAELGRGIASK